MGTDFKEDDYWMNGLSAMLAEPEANVALWIPRMMALAGALSLVVFLCILCSNSCKTCSGDLRNKCRVANERHVAQGYSDWTYSCCSFSKGNCFLYACCIALVCGGCCFCKDSLRKDDNTGCEQTCVWCNTCECKDTCWDVWCKTNDDIHKKNLIDQVNVADQKINNEFAQDGTLTEEARDYILPRLSALLDPLGEETFLRNANAEEARQNEPVSLPAKYGGSLEAYEKTCEVLAEKNQESGNVEKAFEALHTTEDGQKPELYETYVLAYHNPNTNQGGLLEDRLPKSFEDNIQAFKRALREDSNQRSNQCTAAHDFLAEHGISSNDFDDENFQKFVRSLRKVGNADYGSKYLEVRNPESQCRYGLDCWVQGSVPLSLALVPGCCICNDCCSDKVNQAEKQAYGIDEEGKPNPVSFGKCMCGVLCPFYEMFNNCDCDNEMDTPSDNPCIAKCKCCKAMTYCNNLTKVKRAAGCFWTSMIAFTISSVFLGFENNQLDMDSGFAVLDSGFNEMKDNWFCLAIWILAITTFMTSVVYCCWVRWSLGCYTNNCCSDTLLPCARTRLDHHGRIANMPLSGVRVV